MLDYDETVFRKLEKAFNESPYSQQVGDYWSSYVASIVSVINREQLSGFGDNYALTQGFGDALRYEAPRQRIRKLVRIPAIYKAIEKALVIRAQRQRAPVLFQANRAVFSNPGFAIELAKELDSTTRALSISRYFEVDGKRAPFRYWMFLIYLEMLDALAGQAGLDAKAMLSGNYLDIGGGYGSSVDGMAIYKKFTGIGAGTVNYDIDQFPVTFIANQYLRYRQPSAVLPVIAQPGDQVGASAQKPASAAHSFSRVIQNNMVSATEGLNISFFFNSNSFQEMDTDQVEEYCQFMKRNKAATAYLGAYLYDSDKASNDPAKAVSVIESHFKQIGSLKWTDLFSSRGLTPPSSGVVKGAYRLFAL